MLVNNFKSALGRCMCNSTDEAYFPIISTSGDGMSLGTDVTLMTRPMPFCRSNVSTNEYGTFVCVGTSDEPVTRNQINLMQYCNDVECLSSKSWQFNAKEDQDFLYRINSLITLPADSEKESVTIKEVGVFYKSTNTFTAINRQQSVICMIYREVLEEPVVLQRGELHNFSVEIKMIESETDGLVKIIPRMTSFTTPSGEVSASINQSDYPAYNAFNEKAYVKTDAWVATTSASKENWIQYKSDKMFYPTSIKFNSYFRRKDEDCTFTYKFSADGEEWDSLNPIDIRRWKPAELGDDFIFTATTGIHQQPSTYETLLPKEMREKAYKYFKLEINGTNNYGNESNQVIIPGLQIYGRFTE